MSGLPHVTLTCVGHRNNLFCIRYYFVNLEKSFFLGFLETVPRQGGRRETGTLRRVSDPPRPEKAQAQP